MTALPAAFAELDVFAACWACPTENARSQVRWSASPADFRALHDAVMPRLDEMLAMLSGYSPHTLPPDVHRLFLLTCAFAEASPHHELYAGSAAVPFSFAAPRFRAMHGDLVQ